MTKIVRKLHFNDSWNILRDESWYTHMAQQGLFLKNKGKFFTYFEQRPSQNMKYRIEVSKKALEDAQIDFYETSGWDYVTSYHYFHVFCSPAELNAPEIHTDPTQQAVTLKQLNNRLMTSLLMLITVIVFNLAMTWAIFFLDGTAVYQLVQGTSASQLLMQVVLFLLMIQMAQAVLSIRRLKINLQSGIALVHDRPWQKKSWLQSSLIIGYFLIALLSCCISFLQIYLSERGTLTEQDTRFPAVSLAAVEGNPALTLEESWYSGINYGSMYDKSWSPLAPTQYSVRQSGIVPNKLWTGENSEYSPSIDTEFYEVSFEFLARPLARDLMKWYDFGDGRLYSKVADSRFDVLYTREDYPMLEIAAHKGKMVVYVRYFGDAKKGQVIEQVATFLVSGSNW